MLRLLDEAAVSYQAVLTKIDKLKASELAGVIASTQEALKTHPAAALSLFATSATTGAGLAELKAEIADLALACGALPS